jgi:hypothetical protein
VPLDTVVPNEELSPKIKSFAAIAVRRFKIFVPTGDVGYVKLTVASSFYFQLTIYGKQAQTLF